MKYERDNPFEILDNAEKWLADNKRAGAVSALIDLCRQQQHTIDEHELRLRKLGSYAYTWDPALGEIEDKPR